MAVVNCTKHQSLWNHDRLPWTYGICCIPTQDTHQWCCVSIKCLYNMNDTWECLEYLLSGSSFIRHQAATCWTWTVWYPRIKIALPSISWQVDSISLLSTLLSVILTKSKHTYIPEVGLIRNPMIRFYHNASLSTVTKTCRKCTNVGIRLLSAALWLNGIKLALTCNRFLIIQQVSVTNSQKSHALLST